MRVLLGRREMMRVKWGRVEGSRRGGHVKVQQVQPAQPVQAVAPANFFSKKQEGNTNKDKRSKNLFLSREFLIPVR